MFIFSIDKIFRIPNHGLLLIYNKIQEVFFKIRDNIKLINPYNTFFFTSIIGIVFEINGILISNEIKKKIFLAEQKYGNCNK